MVTGRTEGVSGAALIHILAEAGPQPPLAIISKHLVTVAPASWHNYLTGTVILVPWGKTCCEKKHSHSLTEQSLHKMGDFKALILYRCSQVVGIS